MLVVSILLSTLYLPVGATQTAAPTETSSAVSSVSEDVMAAAELLAGVPVDFEKEAILQHVDQDAFRASNHVRRLPEEETLDTFVYLNQDGTKSVYFMEENVKYVDSAGKVQNKDISMWFLVIWIITQMGIFLVLMKKILFYLLQIKYEL